MVFETPRQQRQRPQFHYDSVYRSAQRITDSGIWIGNRVAAHADAEQTRLSAEKNADAAHGPGWLPAQAVTSQSCVAAIGRDYGRWQTEGRGRGLSSGVARVHWPVPSRTSSHRLGDWCIEVTQIFRQFFQYPVHVCRLISFRPSSEIVTCPGRTGAGLLGQ